jgi:hypothetical protein
VSWRPFAYNVAFAVLVICPVAWFSHRAGLPWWLAGVIAVAVFAALWKLLAMQIGVKARSRYDLERFIQGLLVTREDGGWLDVKPRGSSQKIRIIRASGDDSTAEVVLSIPRAAWSQPKADQLARMFERQGISFTTDPGSFVQEDSLMEARVEIPSIWTGSAGAKPARVAHLILDTFDVGPAERLDVRLEGLPSDRWKEHREELVNL